MQCPFCRTELPAKAVDCTRCDWVRPARVQSIESRRRDWASAVMSLVPGLGHAYKGHVVFGMIVLLVVGPGLLGLVLVLLPMTLGLSSLILPLFVAGVAFHAFQARDVRTEVPDMFAPAKKVGKE